MRFVTYNIQYSLGRDGRHDLGRIADAVRDADVVCLQEVVRNVAGVPDADQPQRLGELLPDHHWVYGPCVDLHAGRDRRTQFGNMVVARRPILSSRLLLLPRVRTYEIGSGQRGALEAVVAAPDGPLRVYSTHLDHVNPRHRRDQIRHLLPLLFAVPTDGAAYTGPNWLNGENLPIPDDFVLMGDFNFDPSASEYAEVVGETDYYEGVALVGDRLADTWTLAGHPAGDGVTWRGHADGRDWALRVDYGFVTPGLASRVLSAHIDDQAAGSDHQPAWFELGA